MHVHMYTSGTVPYVPTSPPSTKEHTSEQDELEERREPTTTYNLYLGLGLGVLQEPGVQPPTPSPAHTHTHTHPHTHTRGNKSLIPLSTFHFLYLSTGTYLLPGTSMYCILSTVVKKSKIRLDHTYIPTTLPLPTSLDHRSSFTGSM